MRASPLSSIARVVAFMLAVMMGGMAYLQLNDPDPMMWVIVYSYLALTCLISAIWGVFKVAAWLGLAVTLLWAAALFPSVYELFRYHSASDLLTGMSPDRPYVEESRESLGLLIGSIAMACVLFLARNKSDPSH